MTLRVGRGRCAGRCLAGGDELILLHCGVDFFSCRKIFHVLAGGKLLVVCFHQISHLGPKSLKATGPLRLNPFGGEGPKESRFGKFAELLRVFLSFYKNNVVLCICVSVYCVYEEKNSPISRVPF